ncbi:hypothetical protein CLOM_g24426 [Closterium sp. NIES-68]|nr:hypothetical protein CLOM_g24426 [Closterium sp. NIES-68]GJP58171.1 hypothetical protein CLOP_g22344 [Closterium sp. NIES-67]GJP60843.1 hypothetical protein CLOP_g18059 [Closterium sp. NIES-67]
MAGLHWRKKGGGKDSGGESSARKQVVLTAAQLAELESYIQDMEAKCAQFQAVVAAKAAAEADMRGQLEGLAAGVEGERATRESALDALLADFESRVSARLPAPSSGPSPLPTITSSAAAAPTEPDSISPPSALAPASRAPAVRPPSLPTPSLPSSVSSSLTTYISSSSEIEALAQRARAAALAAAAAAAGRGAAAAGAGGGYIGGEFPGVAAAAGGVAAYPGGPHSALIPTSSTGAGSMMSGASGGAERGDGGWWNLGLGLRWNGGRVQRRQRFMVDTAWLEGIRRDYMELQRQLAEEQHKTLVVQQLRAEKAWMEAALVRFLEMKRQHEAEVAQLMAKVARLEQAVAASRHPADGAGKAT